MSTQIIVPPMGESVSEATVAKWLKNVGDSVVMDEPLVELETDKVTLEVNATAAGVLAEIMAPAGSNVKIGALLGSLQSGAVAASAPKAAAATPAAAVANQSIAPQAMPMAANAGAPAMMPAARKAVEEQGLNPYSLAGTGKHGMVTKEDVINQSSAAKVVPMTQPAPSATPLAPAPRAAAPAVAAPATGKPEERVRMTRLRQRIAQRLKEAQNTAAMLTTFNEIDMTNVMALRNQYKDTFEKKHGTKLGFMSFFVKACIVALKEIPAVNAEIQGDDIVYKNYYDIGVAVGT
ncbi:MAG: dihydrolipoamide succinyltransferase, partial [Alphaproteobacteria bacterium]|nr:dihydrolipoamide succinyltransferase [Alphaproteobacteria bacterium]